MPTRDSVTVPLPNSHSGGAKRQGVLRPHGVVVLACAMVMLVVFANLVLLDSTTCTLRKLGGVWLCSPVISYG